MHSLAIPDATRTYKSGWSKWQFYQKFAILIDGTKCLKNAENGPWAKFRREERVARSEGWDLGAK